MATDTAFNSRNAFVYIRGSYHSKNIVKSRWLVHLRFGRHPQETCVVALSLTPRSYTSGTLQSRILGWMFIMPMHCRKNQLELSEDSQSRRYMAQTWWRIVITWNLSPCCIARCNPVRFITCHGTIPMPTSWRTTFGIHRLRPACGRRERPERCFACGAEQFQRHRQVPEEVCPEYSEWKWRTRQVSCSQARIPLEIQQTPTILQESNQK